MSDFGGWFKATGLGFRRPLAFLGWSFKVTHPSIRTQTSTIDHHRQSFLIVIFHRHFFSSTHLGSKITAATMFDLSNIYDVVDTMPELHIIATMVSLLLSTAASFYASLMKRKKKGRFSLIARSRRSMRYFIQQLGPRNFRRAYRMTPRQYWKLCGLLKPYLAPKKGVGPNGHIYPEIEISATLRYLAGGDPYDIHLTHGIGYTTFFSCVWRVINAINSCPALKIRFPTDHKLKKK